MKNYILTIIALAISLTAGAQTSTTGFYRGDINNDNIVDIADVAALIKVLNGGTANDACKVNGDSTVDLQDLAELVDIILGKKEKVWVENSASIPAGDTSNKPKAGSDGNISSEAKSAVVRTIN